MESTDAEVKAISSIAETLSQIKNKEMQKRVLSWAWSKFVGTGEPSGKVPPHDESRGTGNPPFQQTGSNAEIPGVAVLSPEGELKITARDLKCGTTNDAAIRLAHIVTYAYCKLANAQAMSSKGVLVPILKSWRAYNGNTRTALRGQRGILRSGDLLSLDTHSIADAEKYIGEILDPEITGTWKPNSSSKKKVVAPKKKK